MRKRLCAIVLGLGFLSASVVLADARYDVRIVKEKDDKGSVVYMLANKGTKRLKAKVSYEKNCRSTTSSKKPEVREHWLGVGESRRLRKVMANSDCRHDFKVVSAEYY